jgi:hypothetical protein
MTQQDIDKIIINTEMSCKMKVKQLIPLLMEIHQVVYKNAYTKAKNQVDPEWVKKETLRKNIIIKNKCLNDPEYLENKRKKEREYRLRVQQKKLENTIC